MDPIERLNLYMTMWEQWVRRYESYKYHGQRLNCQKGVYLKPIVITGLYPLGPPIYYIYNFTFDETFGYVHIFLSKSKKSLLYSTDGCLFFHANGSVMPYDKLNIVISNPKTDGSLSFLVSFWSADCGIYKEDIINWNTCSYQYKISSPLISHSDELGKTGLYQSPYYEDWWRYINIPNFWSYVYSFNWSYNSTTKKYDIWDNQGNKVLGSSSTSFNLSVYVNWVLQVRKYTGFCYREIGVKVSNLIFYSGNLIPPP